MRLAVVTGAAGDHLGRISDPYMARVKELLIQFEGHPHHRTGYLFLGLLVAGIIGASRFFIFRMAERTRHAQFIAELIDHDPGELFGADIFGQYSQVLVGRGNGIFGASGISRPSRISGSCGCRTGEEKGKKLLSDDLS